MPCRLFLFANCSLVAYELYFNSCYFLRQEKCKLIESKLAAKSIQTERDTWTKSCWVEESTPRGKNVAGQANACPKSAISTRPIFGKLKRERRFPVCKCSFCCAKRSGYLRPIFWRRSYPAWNFRIWMYFWSCGRQPHPSKSP